MSRYALTYRQAIELAARRGDLEERNRLMRDAFARGAKVRALVRAAGLSSPGSVGPILRGVERVDVLEQHVDDGEPLR